MHEVTYGENTSKFNEDDEIDDIKLLVDSNRCSHRLYGLFKVTATVYGETILSVPKGLGIYNSSFPTQGWGISTNVSTGVSYSFRMQENNIMNWGNEMPVGTYMIDYQY